MHRTRRRWSSRIMAAAVVAVAAGGVTSMGPAQAATPSRSYTGTLSDGADWMADVPAAWNGTLILFSHGYGPLQAQDAPDPATKKELLAEGYALAGSSYSGPSMWALQSAVNDQFASLRAVQDKIGHPQRTIAWGRSMGGLVSALETQDPRHQVDGTLTTCGLVGGALNLNNYQLDGEYAASRLLAPEQKIQLVGYRTPQQASTALDALNTATSAAQNSPQGRARIALAAALINEPTWYSGQAAPDPHDYAAQEAQQEQTLVGPGFSRYVTGRQQIELSAGGNSAYTAGVDYRALLNSSSHTTEVRALYKQGGLDLNADLSTLTRDADIHADPRAVASLTRTSMATGHLGVPELDIHTTSDQLVPVEQENWYAQRVAQAGDSHLLRQAYVQGTGHCAFQPAEQIAALHALEHRLDTGRWDNAARPTELNAAATALNLGTTPRYAPFHAPRLVGGLGEPGRDRLRH
ncbi:alpha/beta hydrolase [Streptomyces sp. NPDC051320]|uniref:alpha/beta hydrolase n=1 Tax=Streptomyces sp. NPDC051320 TaxID=3154644 RepID=UPI003423753C